MLSVTFLLPPEPSWHTLHSQINIKEQAFSAVEVAKFFGQI